MNLALGHRHLTLNVQPGASAHAEHLVELVRGIFPRAGGPDSDELDRKGMRVGQLLGEAAEAIEAAKKAKDEANNSESEAAKAKTQAAEAAEAAAATKAHAEQVAQRDTQAEQLVAKIRSFLADAQAARDAAKEANDETGPPLEKIRAFSSEVDEERTKLADLHSDSDTRLKTAATRSKEILDKHTQLQTEIEEHLKKAVGAGLFGAFNERKRELVSSKWRFAFGAAILAVAQVGVIWWVADYLHPDPTRGEFNVVIFGLRLGASVPIVGILLWCIRQYSRERDFEEIYAFKAALAFSLKPYLDLVEDLPAVDDSKHQEFVTSTIRQVFEYPIERGREGRRERRRQRKSIPEDLIKDLATFMRNVQP